ncbi:hypothetical protein [Yeosuana marina]|uniref:hypothetical protein n=1 Tax=Yeosuana marina TaxID=1565536 RepID=UPI0030C7B935
MKAENISFLLGIVLYKLKISDSSTINSLVSIKKFLNNINTKIVIWDNSPNSQNIKELESLNNFVDFEYKHTPENVSLAKIYNSIYKNNSQYGSLILFDQDSEIDEDYFLKLNSAQKKYQNINLFLPIIKAKNLVYSPANRFLVTGRHWKNERYGIIKSLNKLAITSGMAIRMNYLLNKYPCFNEDLNLYGVDTDFMIQYEKLNKYFFVLDYVMKHDLSVFTEDSKEMKLLRYRNHKKAIIKIFKNESILKFWLAKAFIILSSIKQSIKYRSFKFLKND